MRPQSSEFLGGSNVFVTPLRLFLLSLLLIFSLPLFHLQELFSLKFVAFTIEVSETKQTLIGLRQWLLRSRKNHGE